MVHLNVAALPGTRPVTADAGSLGLVIVAAPDTTVHAPVPTTAVLPANVVVVPHTV